MMDAAAPSALLVSRPVENVGGRDVACRTAKSRCVGVIESGADRVKDDADVLAGEGSIVVCGVEAAKVDHGRLSM